MIVANDSVGGSNRRELVLHGIPHARNATGYSRMCSSGAQAVPSRWGSCALTARCPLNLTSSPAISPAPHVRLRVIVYGSNHKNASFWAHSTGASLLLLPWASFPARRTVRATQYGCREYCK